MMPQIAIGFAVVVLGIPLLWQLFRLWQWDRVIVDNVFLYIPLIGPILRRNLLARWCDVLRMGVQGGMDLPAAITLAGETTGSPALIRDGQRLVDTLNVGKQASEMRRGKVLPPSIIAVIQLASDRQDLPAALAALAHMYQQQAEVRVSTIPSILTPILLIGIGIVLTFVVVALFAPMISLIQAVSGPGKK
jgi:type II secretory pathway component PulF